MPRATSGLNAIQRIAGAIGTALLAIVLQRAIASEVPGGAGRTFGVAARPSQSDAAQLVANAFGTTFWVATGLIAAALVPALLLPRRRRRRRDAPALTTVPTQPRPAS
jgi:hypothetical protein